MPYFTDLFEGKPASRKGPMVNGDALLRAQQLQWERNGRQGPPPGYDNRADEANAAAAAEMRARQADLDNAMALSDPEGLYQDLKEREYRNNFQQFLDNSAEDAQIIE